MVFRREEKNYIFADNLSYAEFHNEYLKTGPFNYIYGKSNGRAYYKKDFLWIFMAFFTGYFSMIGSQLVSFSVTWYLTEQEGSKLILSLATLSNMSPMILVSPIAGILADRRSKNKILFFTDFTQALATFILILLFIFNMNTIWQILVLMAIRGTCQGFQMLVAVSLNAIMVPKKHIQRRIIC